MDGIPSQHGLVIISDKETINAAIFRKNTQTRFMPLLMLEKLYRLEMMNNGKSIIIEATVRYLLLISKDNQADQKIKAKN